MPLLNCRRIISGIALLAFLFSIAVPALAVVRQAIDPTSFATICRVDVGTTGDPAGPAVPRAAFGHAHCLMCVSTASPPPLHAVAPVVVTAVLGLLLPADRGLLVAGAVAALHPLEPRAPPRA